MALAEVPYPGYSRDIVSFGLVDEIQVTDGEVDVQLVLDSDREDVPDELRRAIRDRLRPLAGERAGPEGEVAAPPDDLPDEAAEAFRRAASGLARSFSEPSSDSERGAIS